MLPPVRAALSSNIDYQGFSPSAPIRPRVDVATGPQLNEPDAAGPLSGGRLDVLSLSAQLRLAQSFSVFAETIGRLLKIPRRENEALVDYAARLSEAMQALKPSERAAVERLLNEIVKGTSLRLLAEILKNPAGPDAARLAVYMETANTGERDLAAKAVVGSYRQNGSTEAPTGSGTARAVTVNGQPVPQSSPSASATFPTISASADAPTPLAEDPRSQSGKPAAKGEESPQSRFTARLPASVISSLPLETNRQQASSPLPDPASSRPVTEALPAGMPPKTAGIDGPHQAFEKSVGSSIESHGNQSDDGVQQAADEARQPVRSAKHEDTARRAGEPIGRDTLSGRAVSTATYLKMPELTGLLAEILADGDLQETSGLPDRNRPQPQIPATQADPSENRANAVKPQPTGAALALSTPQEPNRMMEEPASDGLHPRTASPAPAADVMETPAMALAGALPLVLAREGVPWPYVTYPPAEEEPRREERKARPVAEIGDEEEDAPPQDHGFHGEERDDRDEENNPSRDEIQVPDEDEGRANDLYWRMAGWT